MILLFNCSICNTALKLLLVLTLIFKILFLFLFLFFTTVARGEENSGADRASAPPKFITDLKAGSLLQSLEKFITLFGKRVLSFILVQQGKFGLN